ncbi:hypothetical protein LSG31_21430 [Fodinisporobacter ferrooxydans]|uniref:Nudix hydrolase domain-containing protein n=1 Tax=Fodinisporobacter ferrooxydans TaxID=2901836 RepID=A0ABY4CIP8_9BACL|nr:hypothetical protein LSG31_21430 [Alicyclobacillaceae bacterium MYW30-H2]
MVPIRMASTVVLLKCLQADDVHAYDIYTMKRPDTMKFLPGYTVFPGGGLEPGDYAEEWLEYVCNFANQYEILPEREDCRTFYGQQKGGKELDRVFVVAAIREVFEETGMLICLSDSLSEKILQPAFQMTVQACQQKLLNKELTFLEAVKTLQLRFDAGQMSYIGSRLTPPGGVARFYTKFFITRVSDGMTSTPSRDEMTAEAWLKPADALDMYGRKEIVCAPPTLECLKGLQQLADIAALF